MLDNLIDQDWPALALSESTPTNAASRGVFVSPDYAAFLADKRADITALGFDVSPDDINPKLYPFQRDAVRWALRLGRAAHFFECGLGKTFMQLDWARLVVKHTGGKVLILTPLAVGKQTIKEAEKLGNIEIMQIRDQSELGDNDQAVVNYERLHLIDASQYAGVVLDESSILKSYTGKTKQDLIAKFAGTPYKLCATATPAPNDHLELGNHAEFLGIMPSNEMIMRWFINDTMQAGGYRLKGHAEKDFYRWLTSWAVFVGKPSDLGAEYDMPNYVLPELKIHEHRLSASNATIARSWDEGRLIPDDAPSSTTIHKVKRESLADRVNEAVAIVRSIPEDQPVIVWCDTNYEADALIAALPDAIEVRGSHKPELKEQRLTDFSEGKSRLIITKPDIAGFGLNWQHCSEQVFVGVSFSFEKFYQSVRRSWRYGQPHPVNAHLVYAETEGNVLETLKRKQQMFTEMQGKASAAMQEYGLFRKDSRLSLMETQTEKAEGKNWQLYLGDSCEVIRQLPDNSVDFGIHSPPFSNLYIYSDNEADMGNSADDDEFFTHYEFLIKDLYRTTRPGRLCAVHCKDLPAYMNRDGAAGLIDFPGKIITAFEKCGWQYHSRVTIWKDPVIEMERTNNHGLLHRNFATTSAACRQGMPDYLIVFRKWPVEGEVKVSQVRTPGDYVGDDPPQLSDYTNSKRSQVPPWYTGTLEQYNYSIAVWQRYASPVWFDIDQTNVLNYEMAKAKDDERHICPLQLDVIERAIDLWTNPGETVFTPFAGVGSEVVTAVKMGRKGIGIELKDSYWRQAIKFCAEAERVASQVTLFDWAGIAS